MEWEGLRVLFRGIVKPKSTRQSHEKKQVQKREGAALSIRKPVFLERKLWRNTFVLLGDPSNIRQFLFTLRIVEDDVNWTSTSDPFLFFALESLAFSILPTELLLYIKNYLVEAFEIPLEVVVPSCQVRVVTSSVLHLGSARSKLWYTYQDSNTLLVFLPLPDFVDPEKSGDIICFWESVLCLPWLTYETTIIALFTEKSTLMMESPEVLLARYKQSFPDCEGLCPEELFHVALISNLVKFCMKKVKDNRVYPHLLDIDDMSMAKQVWDGIVETTRKENQTQSCLI